jgi:adenylate kinase family enzyme
MMLGPRVVIIGNSGSGKTTLAGELGLLLDRQVYDLDRIHWQEAIGVKRDEAHAKSMVSAIAAEPQWIIEGVFGWLVAEALPFATSLVWMDLPWIACREGLDGRGPSTGATIEQHAELLAWAEAYWRRSTSTSFAGHLALFEAFAGEKCRLIQRCHAKALLAAEH